MFVSDTPSTDLFNFLIIKIVKVLLIFLCNENLAIMFHKNIVRESVGFWLWMCEIARSDSVVILAETFK